MQKKCEDLAIKYGGLEDDSAYRRAYLQTHPDKGGRREEFEALKDCQKAKFYKKNGDVANTVYGFNKPQSYSAPDYAYPSPSKRKYSAPDYYAYPSSYYDYTPLPKRMRTTCFLDYMSRPKEIKRGSVEEIMANFYELRPEARPSQKRRKSKKSKSKRKNTKKRRTTR